MTLRSEHEVTSNDEVWMKRIGRFEFIDEKNNGDEYEMKWSQLRAQINVGSLINLSGATKILSSQQTAKSFFALELKYHRSSIAASKVLKL